MAYGIPTDLTTILDNIINKLGATDAVVDPAAIGVTLDEAAFWQTWPVHDQFIMLRPIHFRAHAGIVMGGGRTAYQQDGHLEVSLYSRSAGDDQGKALQWLKNTSYGAWRKFKLILQSLEQYECPTGGDNLLVEPMRLVEFSFLSQSGTPKTVGRIVAVFEMKYTQDLS